VLLNFVRGAGLWEALSIQARVLAIQASSPAFRPRHSGPGTRTGNKTPALAIGDAGTIGPGAAVVRQ